MVKSMGEYQFSNFRFNSRGDVLGVEENCLGGGICPRVKCPGGNVQGVMSYTRPVGDRAFRATSGATIHR